MTTREDRHAALKRALEERIVILDGAMGSMVQTYELDEAAYRGARFADHSDSLKGNNDLLVLTQPAIISEIHEQFLDAGADILETNTFNAQVISQADYGLEDASVDINLAAAHLARTAADKKTAETPDKPRFVAGSLGPTNRTASLSPDVERPGFRNVSFDELRSAYKTQARALFDGGVDTFLVETIFDTLNAKAALFAIDEVIEETGVNMPVMVSGTITDLSGRNLSGQTVEALWHSVRHVRPLTFGLNCAFGGEQLRPYVKEIARVVDTFICIYPNAGLPNEFGEYDETPEQTAAIIRDWADEGLVNLVGGCCGTTPDHIRAIAETVKGLAPRPMPDIPAATRLSGLEPLVIPA